jgi:hypothetical protein
MGQGKYSEGCEDSYMKQSADEWYEKHARIEEKPIGEDIENKVNTSSRRYPTLTEAEQRAQRHAGNLLIFGLRLKQIGNPIRIGNLILYPKFNLSRYLKGYEPTDVQFIVESDVVFARYQPISKHRTPLFSPQIEDDSLIHFRLFKPGWLTALNIIPVTRGRGMEIRGSLGSLREIFGQIWAEPMSYELKANSVPKIQRIYDDLVTLPTGYLELALRRFSRSYGYYTHSEYAGLSELDDCLVDLVIALESITSRGGDSIRQSMALRTALLVGKSLETRKKAEELVKKFYDQRSQILHGAEKDKIPEKNQKERFLALEDLRDLTRKTINASVVVLKEYIAHKGTAPQLPKALAEIIDNYLFDNINVKRRRLKAD